MAWATAWARRAAGEPQTEPDEEKRREREEVALGEGLENRFAPLIQLLELGQPVELLIPDFQGDAGALQLVHRIEYLLRHDRSQTE